MNEIIFATNNKNKAKEIEELLKQFSIKVKTLNDFNLKGPIEDGLTFEENSIIKAKYAFEKTNIPSLADDSGFCINSLNGFPGLVSSRFIKAVGGEEKSFEVLNKCISECSKTCYFICNLAFIYKDKNEEEIIKNFEGRIEGQFTFPAKGIEGFGFDPIFTPNGYDKTFAEMFEIKKQISHRALALNKFFEFFKTIQNEK